MHDGADKVTLYSDDETRRDEGPSDMSRSDLPPSLHQTPTNITLVKQPIQVQKLQVSSRSCIGYQPLSPASGVDDNRKSNSYQPRQESCMLQAEAERQDKRRVESEIMEFGNDDHLKLRKVATGEVADGRDQNSN